MNYENVMEYINSFSKTGSKVTDLSRIATLLKKLDNPQNKLKFVHIAGTNGKGSTLELSSQILINAGYVVGQFTSPYMRCYEDRIRINNENINKKDMVDFISIISNVVDSKDGYSQFEITMSIAFLYYVKYKCDIVFLEVGIGGRFDSTNIIDTPLVSVITSISYDHVKLLGDTLKKIAYQKAGIIKNKIPVVLSSNNNKDVEEVVEQEAEKNNSKLIIPDINECKIINQDIKGTNFVYKGNEYYIGMIGSHQIINAMTVIEMIEILKQENFNIKQENILNALKKVSVPARVEHISKNPNIIIDGSHNMAGITSLIETINKMEFGLKIVIFGMVSDKDYVSVTEKINEFADIIICVDDFADNCINKNELLSLIQKEKYTVTLKNSFSFARKFLKKPSDVIVVCGSLYLASEIVSRHNYIF